MRILLPYQEQRLLSVIRPGEPFGPRDRALVTFALHTGLRSHELCGLNVGHVMTWDGFPRQWVEVVGKGGRVRQVPLNSVARQAVVDLVHFNRSRGFAVAGESPLLVTRRHGRLPTRSLRDLRRHAGFPVGTGARGHPADRRLRLQARSPLYRSCGWAFPVSVEWRSWTGHSASWCGACSRCKSF